jgi:beta-glucosidase
MKRHDSQAKQIEDAAASGQGIDLLMIGDSITHGWEGGGKAVWAKYYGHRKAVNLGISGDRTEHVLWRLDNLPLNKIHPKAAVLMIGTNNIGHKGGTAPKDAADGIKAIVQKLEKTYPDIKILVLYVFPRGNQSDDGARKKVIEIHSYLAELLKDEKNVTLLNINKVFLDENDVLQPTVMKDFLHPGADGYQLWAEAIEPALAKLLGDSEVKK